MNLNEEEVKKQISYFEGELQRNKLMLEMLKHYLQELRSKKRFIKTGSNKIDWRKIIIQILKKENQLLSTYEIYELALSDHPEISDYSKATSIRQISSCLTHLCDKKEKCERFTIKGEKGNLWGLTEFFTRIDTSPFPVPLQNINNLLIKKGIKTGILESDYDPVEISMDYDDMERRGE